jgi:hypothetical protein
MNCCVKIGTCLFGIIAFILSLSGLASFSLGDKFICKIHFIKKKKFMFYFLLKNSEIAKIALFNQTNGELKLHPMDYVYLCALFLGRKLLNLIFK